MTLNLTKPAGNPAKRARPFFLPQSTAILHVITALVLALTVVWVRFDRITYIGIHGRQQWEAVGKWVEGNPGPSRYHYSAEVLYAVVALCTGLTDYTIKATNCALDCVSVALICLATSSLARNRWVGLCAGALYGFVPLVVYYARADSVYIAATFYGVCLFACFLRYAAQMPECNWRAKLWLGLAGVFCGLAASAHLTMLYMGPGYIVLILLLAVRQGVSFKSIGRFVTDLSIFIMCAILVFIAFIVLYAIMSSFERVEALAASYGRGRLDFAESYTDQLVAVQGYVPSFLDNVAGHLLVGIRAVVTSAFEMQRAENAEAILRLGRWDWYGPLFLATPVIIVALARKGQRNRLEAYFPLVIVLAYVAGEAGSPVSVPAYVLTARHFVHVFPLVVVAVSVWWYEAFSAVDRRLATPALAAITASMLVVHPMVFPGNEGLGKPQSAGKELSLLLGDAVNEENRLLVLPYSISTLGAFHMKYPIYFAPDNVVYVRYESAEEGPLARLCERRDIRFVYVSRHTSSNPARWEGKAPSSAKPDLYGMYHGDDVPEKQRFSEAREAKILGTFLREQGAARVYESDSFSLYLLPRPGDELLDHAHPIGRLMIRATRFEVEMKIEELRQRYGAASITCHAPLDVDVMNRKLPQAGRIGITWPTTDPAKPTTMPEGQDLFVEGWCAGSKTPDIQVTVDGTPCKVRYYPATHDLDEMLSEYPYRMQWIVRIPPLSTSGQSLFRVSLNDTSMEFRLSADSTWDAGWRESGR